MQTELVDRARRGDREAFSVLAGGAVDRCTRSLASSCATRNSRSRGGTVGTLGLHSA